MIGWIRFSEQVKFTESVTMVTDGKLTLSLEFDITVSTEPVPWISEPQQSFMFLVAPEVELAQRKNWVWS